MSDTLYAGNRSRTFNVVDDSNRKYLAVEVDTSIIGKRLIRDIREAAPRTRLKPEILRADIGPEALSGEFIAWAQSTELLQ